MPFDSAILITLLLAIAFAATGQGVASVPLQPLGGGV